MYRITTNGSIAVEAYGFIQPQGVLADKQGRKYVADASAGTVYRLDANGQITTLASGLQNPCCLGFDAKGNILVSHEMETTGAITRLTPDGEQTTIATGFINAQGLLVDQSGHIVVAAEGFEGEDESLASGLFRIKANGKVEQFVDLGGIQPGGLALGSKGAILFSGTSEGEGYLFTTVKNGEFETLLRGFQKPGGIAANSDAIYVADEAAGDVWKVFLSKTADVADNADNLSSILHPPSSLSPVAHPPTPPPPQSPGNPWGYHGAPDYDKIPVTPEGVPSAGEGTTAVIGRVLRTDDAPLGNVTVRLGRKATRTNSQGWWMLPDVPAGHQVMMFDARSADRDGIHYPITMVAWKLDAHKDNRLPFTTYCPILDTAHTTQIDPKRDTVHTTPLIPGLEIHIPKGAKITSVDGTPVTSITTTLVPYDKPLYPMSLVKDEGNHFTMQPGGAVSSKPIRVVYPNLPCKNPQGYPRGTRVQLWEYDPMGHGGWHQYGTGAVTESGNQIEAENGEGFRVFGCALSSRTLVPRLGTGGCVGRPVDLATGAFFESATDLVVPGLMPLVLKRTLRNQSSFSRHFGINMFTPFDLMRFGSPGGGLGSYIEFYDDRDTAFRFIFTTSTPHNTYAATEAGTNDVRFAGAKILQIKTQNYPTADGNNYFLYFKDGTMYGFDGHGHLREIRDPSQNSILIERDGPGLGMTKITQPSGRYLIFEYNTSGPATNYVSKVTDSSERFVSYAYDASNRVSVVTNTMGGTTKYFYDNNHNCTNITLPNTVVAVQNTYDSVNRVTQQTLADTGSFLFKYSTNASGIMTQTIVTNQLLKPTTYNFDEFGFQTNVVDALGNTTTYIRDSTTHAIQMIIDPLTRTNSFAYDSNGNITAFTNALGKFTTFTYDSSFNRVATVTDPLSHTTTFTYGNGGTLTSITDANNKTTTITYNEQGLPLSVTDPLGNAYTFSYCDSLDLRTVTDPLGNVVRRQVDTLGRPVQLADPLGRATKLNYTDQTGCPSCGTSVGDLVSQIVDARSGTNSFGYDAVGNLTNVTDALTHVVSYQYDGVGQLTNRIDQLLNPEKYAYDTRGNVTSFTDRRGTNVTFTYDSLDRRTNIAYGTQSTVRLQYDSVSRVTNIVDSVGGTIRLAYDALDRLTTERTPNGTNTYTYNDGGLRTNLTMTGETAITYRYDVLNRLTNVVQGSTSVSLAYDDLGRRTQLTLPNSMVVLYSYDTASRLTNITYQGSTTNKIEYGYWPDGSRYSQNSALAAYLLPSAVASATYNAANQQLTFGSYTNKYDLNGNVTNIHNSAAATTNRIVWNARNQITNLAGSVTARFLYDGLGRRITRVVGSTTERYHYDGLDIMLQKSSSGTVQTRYFRGLGIDEPWQRLDVGGAGTNRSYLADAVGSIVALADGSKVVQTEYDYDPLGTATGSGSGNKNAFKFTGREDDGTGLYYYRARYYHPGLGRFISEDPIEYFGDDINLYVYAYDDPINVTDPEGEVGLAGAAIGAGLEIAFQLLQNGGRIECIDLYDVGVSAGVGAIGVGVLSGGAKVYKAAKELRRLKKYGPDNPLFKRNSKGIKVRKNVDKARAKQEEKIGEAVAVSGGWQAVKEFFKRANDCEDEEPCEEE